MRLNPSMTIKACNQIALIEANRNNLKVAVDTFLEAIKYHEQRETKENIIGSIHLNAAIIFQKLKRSQQSAYHFQKAIEEFHIELEESPNEAGLWNRLGDTLAMTGRMEEASKTFEKALSLDPMNLLYYDNLATALKYQGKTNEAIKVLQNGLKLMTDNGQFQAVDWFKQHISLLENSLPKVK